MGPSSVHVQAFREALEACGDRKVLRLKVGDTGVEADFVVVAEEAPAGLYRNPRTLDVPDDATPSKMAGFDDDEHDGRAARAAANRDALLYGARLDEGGAEEEREALLEAEAAAEAGA